MTSKKDLLTHVSPSGTSYAGHEVSSQPMKPRREYPLCGIGLMLAVALTSAGLYGEDLHYKVPGGSVTSLWSQASNWYDSTLTAQKDRVPMDADRATIGSGTDGGTVLIDGTVAAVAKTLRVGQTANVTNVLVMTGGSFQSAVTSTDALTRGLILGETAGTCGSLEMSGGDLKLDSAKDWGLTVGSYGTGVFDLTGGTVYLGPNGNINIGERYRAEAWFTGGAINGSFNLVYLGVQPGSLGALHVSGQFSHQFGKYYVGHLGEGVLDVDYDGDLSYGSTTGFHPYQVYVGGTDGYQGHGRATFRNKFAITSAQNSNDSRGIHVGNSGSGEVDSYGYVQTGMLDIGGALGAEWRVHQDSEVGVWYHMTVGGKYNGSKCTGVLELQGGTLAFYPHIDFGDLQIGGVDSSSGSGLVRGYGKIKRDSRSGLDAYLSFGYDGRVIADGGELDLSGIPSAVREICEQGNSLSNGYYAVNGGSVVFPRPKTAHSTSGTTTATAGCKPGVELPTLVHAVSASIAGLGKDAYLMATLMDRNSVSVPANCPKRDDVIGVWDVRLYEGGSFGNATATCDSFTLRFRVAPRELKGENCVRVFRSDVYNWEEVPATFDPRTNIVTVGPLTPYPNNPNGNRPSFGRFAIARVKPGMALVIR